MSHKMQLSGQRVNTVINKISKRQESALMRAVGRVRGELEKKYPGISFHWMSQWELCSVIDRLKKIYPDVDFCMTFQTSSMRPDGGVLSILDRSGGMYPILISEKKNQGTNDIRASEGKPRQAKGNAIERLGKNVIGLRTALLNESIFPFVCFGDGCDFAEDSSIIDRVKTIAMFGDLNTVHLHNEGPGGMFNRGTYYFRQAEWTEEEMYSRSLDIAERSILYYFSKYKREKFTAMSLELFTADQQQRHEVTVAVG